MFQYLTQFFKCATQDNRNTSLARGVSNGCTTNVQRRFTHIIMGVDKCEAKNEAIAHTTTMTYFIIKALNDGEYRYLSAYIQELRWADDPHDAFKFVLEKEAREYCIARGIREYAIEEIVV